MVIFNVGTGCAEHRTYATVFRAQTKRDELSMRSADPFLTLTAVSPLTNRKNRIMLKIVLLVSFIQLILQLSSAEVSEGPSCACPSTEEDLSTLRSVYVLMRHGIRAPWTTYPLDPFANDTTRFPNGGSQLTDDGIEQAYNVGKYLKKRYKQFLKGKQKQAYLRSSAAQRCIDTISIVAKKLWPPEVDEEKSWQPMIFSLPQKIDSVLYEEPDCHNAEEEEQNSLKTQEVQNYEKDPKIQELYKFTAEKTGLPPNMYSVTKAFDCIRCEKLNGLKSPDWATPEIYERMGDVLSKRLNFFYKGKKTQRLRAGPILSDFKAQMDKVINSKPQDKTKNVFIYGTHDFKISSVLNALGDPQPKYPPFAGAIVFELHRINDKNIVRAVYLDQTINWPYTGIKLPLTKCTQGGKTSDPSSFAAQLAQNITKTAQNITSKLSKLSPISIPKIPKTNKLFDGPIAAENRGNQECTFEKFVDSISDLTPVDWRTECGIDCTYDPFKSAEDNLGST